MSLLPQDTQLYVSDPKALHHILVKDQYIYDESDMFIEQVICLSLSSGHTDTDSNDVNRSNSLLFGLGLLSTRGEHHRRQRKLLNPVFSTKHMHYMLPIFYGVGHQVRHHLYAWWLMNVTNA